MIPQVSSSQVTSLESFETSVTHYMDVDICSCGGNCYCHVNNFNGG